MAVLAKFEGYSLREIEESDYAVLDQWITQDPAHLGVIDPEFFMGQAIDGHGQLAPDPRVTVFALEDKKHTLMYIRLTRVSRVHIQFPPAPATDGSGEKFKELHKFQREIANALIKGMGFLEVGLERAGCTEWIFDTESAQLRKMAEKRMGFVQSPNELVRIIPRLTSNQAPEFPLPIVPHESNEEA